MSAIHRYTGMLQRLQTRKGGRHETIALVSSIRCDGRGQAREICAPLHSHSGARLQYAGPTVRPEPRPTVPFPFGAPSPRLSYYRPRRMREARTRATPSLRYKTSQSRNALSLAFTEEQPVCAIYSHRGAVSVLADSARSHCNCWANRQQAGRSGHIPGQATVSNAMIIDQAELQKRFKRNQGRQLLGRLQLTSLLTQSPAAPIAIVRQLLHSSSLLLHLLDAGRADARRNDLNLPRTLDLRQRFLDHG